MTIDEHKAGIHATGRKGERQRLICIEGNIGAGKSTLAKDLAESLGALPMFEPVGENPYLELFYGDPERYALEMQFWLMSRRFEMHEEAIRHIWETGQSVVMDRSIYGDWVFAKKNWLDGNIEDVGYTSYLHHRETMSRYLLVPHVVVFLDATPNTCHKRIQERGRACEKTIQFSYLAGLEDLHRELMLDMQMRGSKIVKLNWNQYGDARTVADALGTI